MDLQRLITSAKLGDTPAFDALVRLCQRQVLAVARTILRDEEAAEDVTQAAFLMAWQRLEQLREPEAFPGWVATMARNGALGLCRQHGRNKTCQDVEIESLPDLREGERPPGWAVLTRGLSPKQQSLLELKYAAGLSHAQIGTVLGISEALVKSRLFTLRRHLHRSWGGIPPEPQTLLEEKIMTKIETRQLGAHVMERLSLAAQTLLAGASVAGTEFPAEVLAELGRIDRGGEFLALYGTKPSFGELIEMLGHVDRFTEKRLVEHLEIVDPATAEAIKQNMFVFEDILLCDAAAVRLISAGTDLGMMAIALGGTELRVRNHVLGALELGLRVTLEGLIRTEEGDRHLVAGAQLTIVNHIRDLETAGRLKLLRPAEAEGGWPVFTVV